MTLPRLKICTREEVELIHHFSSLSATNPHAQRMFARITLEQKYGIVAQVWGTPLCKLAGQYAKHVQQFENRRLLEFLDE